MLTKLFVGGSTTRLVCVLLPPVRIRWTDMKGGWNNFLKERGHVKGTMEEKHTDI